MMPQQPSFRSQWTIFNKTRRPMVASVLVLAAIILAWAVYSSSPPAFVILTPAMPTPNAFDDFNKAGTLAIDSNKVDYALAVTHAPHSKLSHSSWPGSTHSPKLSGFDPDDHVYSQPEKDVLLSRNAAALHLLRLGFAHPYLNPPLRSFRVKTTYYMQDRFLARLLTLDAQVKASQSDLGGAVNSDLDAVEMGCDISHGSTLLGMYTSIDCQQTGRLAIWPLVSHLTASQAREAAHRLESLQAKQVPFSDTLLEDKWWTVASLLEMMRAQNWKDQYVDMEWEDENPRLLRLRLALTTKRGLIGAYTQIYDAARSRSRSPYRTYTASSPTLLEPLTGNLADSLQECWFHDTANQAQNSLLMTTLALQAYRQDHGAYPISLKALLPAYLDHIPTDPFDAGRALHYHLSRSGYVLYSVGPDGHDDGGAAVVNVACPSKSSERPDPRYVVDSGSHGDIVAGVNMDQPLHGSM
jgi:hypothetical protein